MNKHGLKEALTQTYQDDRLDKKEKHTIEGLFSGLTREEHAFVRNRAFEMVLNDLPDTTSANKLNWLARVVKALDSNQPEAPKCQSYFSPGNDCLNALLNHIKRSNQSIDICVFTISENKIADALQQAQNRGVKVRVLTDNDKQYDLGSDIAKLLRGGIEVRTDRSSHHMHHKFAIFDRQYLVTGSFNWTRSASAYNHENIMIVEDPISVDAFEREFNALWEEFGENP